MDDNLDDLFTGAPIAPRTADFTDLARAQPVRIAHEEKCSKCRGTGRFITYSGATLGDCFACKGKGTKTFRTSVDQREKGREAAARRRDREAQSMAEQAQAWKLQNPGAAAWMADAVKRGFEFAASMDSALTKYGMLTEKQHAAVLRCAAQSAARQEAWAAEQAERDANKAEIEITKISDALNRALGSIKAPKLRLADFVFSLAGSASANAGAVYVKSNDAVYLGKVQQGRFSRSRDCTTDLEQAILAAAADPEAAAIAYGKAFGRCSCCGRELTNPESIARSMGPICAERFGWA